MRQHELLSDGAAAPPPARTWAVALVSFAVVWGLTCLGISRLIDTQPGARFDEPSIPRLKYKQFARIKDRFDVVFVGSSRFYRQISPAIFDDVLERNGHSLRSFNFGLPGMRHYEIRYAAEWIVSRRPERMRWLVVEPMALHEEFFKHNVATRRNIRWHDPTITLEASLGVLGSEEPLGEKAAMLGIHLRNAFYRFANYDMALSAIQSLLELDQQPALRLDGFLPLDMQSEMTQEGAQTQRRREERKLERFDEYYRRFLEGSDEPGADARWVDALRALAGRIRAAGVQPVFLTVPPTWAKLTDFVAAGEEELGAPLFAYHDLREHPEFYRPEMLFNLDHLNSRGARMLTERFARDFAAYLERETGH